MRAVLQGFKASGEPASRSFSSCFGTEGMCGLQLFRTMQLRVASGDMAELDGFKGKLRTGVGRQNAILDEQ